MGEVKAFYGKGKFPKEKLIDLATNPRLEGFQIVCHWKADEKNPTGYTTVGWTGGMNRSELVFGARHLTLDTDEQAFSD